MRRRKPMASWPVERCGNLLEGLRGGGGVGKRARLKWMLNVDELGVVEFWLSGAVRAGAQWVVWQGF